MRLEKEAMKALEQYVSDDATSKVDLETTPNGKVGGVLVSRLFYGRTQAERQAMLWKHLDQELSKEDHAQIVAIVTLTPEEYS